MHDFCSEQQGANLLRPQPGLELGRRPGDHQPEGRAQVRLPDDRALAGEMDLEVRELDVQPVWPRTAVRRHERGWPGRGKYAALETGYAPPDSRPAVNLLQWIQYQLDNCRTVAEVIANDQKVRIESPPPSLGNMARIHYLVCDADGDSAAIEFLGGKMVVHRGTTLPYRALANDTYDASADYFRAHPEAGKSSVRFAHAAARAASFEASQPRQDLDYVFDTLEQVCQGDFTVWRVGYDVSTRKIYYRTRSNPEERSLDLKTIDFSGAAASDSWTSRTNPLPALACRFRNSPRQSIASTSRPFLPRTR